MKHKPLDIIHPGTVGAFMAPDPRTRMQRLTRRLFPTRCLQPAEDRDGFTPGEVSLSLVVMFDWKDRLRILVSGCLRVETRSQTDVPVNRIESRSAIYVESPLERPYSAPLSPRVS